MNEVRTRMCQTFVCCRLCSDISQGDAQRTQTATFVCSAITYLPSYVWLDSTPLIRQVWMTHGVLLVYLQIQFASIDDDTPEIVAASVERVGELRTNGDGHLEFTITVSED